MADNIGTSLWLKQKRFEYDQNADPKTSQRQFWLWLRREHYIQVGYTDVTELMRIAPFAEQLKAANVTLDRAGRRALIFALKNNDPDVVIKQVIDAYHDAGGDPSWRKQFKEDPDNIENNLSILASWGNLQLVDCSASLTGLCPIIESPTQDPTKSALSYSSILQITFPPLLSTEEMGAVLIATQNSSVIAKQSSIHDLIYSSIRGQLGNTNRDVLMQSVMMMLTSKDTPKRVKTSITALCRWRANFDDKHN